jgi:ubiquinol-cytochrome c reductase cytochrome b subunit
MSVLQRAWHWFDDRSGFSVLVKPIADHPVPRGSGWSYVFGSATLFAFLVQVVTGIALATAYVTSTDAAYDSLKFISHEAPFGSLLRGMHYYGASAMVLMVGLHMIQVFLFGAYKFPRELNWLTGIVLLAVTMALAFTGQLLRWDDNAIWSIFVAASQASRVPIVGGEVARFLIAGNTIGGATLSRFFSFHVFFIPAMVFLLVAVHLAMVLYHGISEPPVPGRPVDPRRYRAWYHSYLKREGVPFWPDAAWRDVVFGVAMVLGIMLLAWLWGPPELGRAPDPSAIDTYPRPDWYFLWFFAALALLPSSIEDYVILIAPLAIGALLILLPFFANRGERSPRRRPWSVAIVVLVVLMIGTLWLAGEQAPWSPVFGAQALPASLTASESAQAQHGAVLFHDKGCLFCHAYSGQGGARGPSLTDVSERMTPERITTTILNGRGNMPSYANSLKPEDVRDLVAFLEAHRLP